METIALESAPGLRSLYARAVVAPIVPGRSDALPDRRLKLRAVEVEPAHVADYSRVCGFAVRDEVPGTYPHLLAFPLQMALMTERSFPFSVLGLIHVANRIEVLGPIAGGDHVDLAVWAQDLRAHRRGAQFDLHAEARSEGGTVWRSRSTYLRRGKQPPGSAASVANGDEPVPAPSLETSAQWNVARDIGRRYGAISGDRNPIHMHPLAARLFGFRRPIAHGMWIKARCLAAFDGRLGAAYTIDVAFKSPLMTPAKARFLTGARDGGWDFRLESPEGEHVHIAGSLTAAR